MIRRISLHNILWRFRHPRTHYNDSLQGFDTNKIWTPEYVNLLRKNIDERYKVMPVLGRTDKFLLDCASVLDVGCGWMPYTPDAARYTGVDVSTAMLARARELHPDIRYIHASSYDLPFPDHSFVGVRSSGMLRHMRYWKPALHEMLRVAQRKLVFSHLVGNKAKQCGRYQWCTTADIIGDELPTDATVDTWVIKKWRDFESVLFKVHLNGEAYD